jgi:hypothetical protein
VSDHPPVEADQDADGMPGAASPVAPPSQRRRLIGPPPAPSNAGGIRLPPSALRSGDVLGDSDEDYAAAFIAPRRAARSSR